MKVSIEQLPRRLETIAPLYLLTGDEPLQMDEARRSIRRQAQAAGYAPQAVLHVEPGFDWDTLAAACCNRSLFSEKQLIELRLSNHKVGVTGAQALTYYTQHLVDDIVLLMSMPKLEAAAQKSKWYQALDQVGVLVPIRPIAADKLEHWVARRMAVRGLQPQAGVAKHLAQRTEGNLLAALQEIEKMWLLFGAGAITLSQVDEVVSEHARFDVFELVDALLAGRSKRALRILFSVRREGVEAIIVLWALHREIRQLADMAYALEQGEAMERLLQRFRVWDSRKSLVKAGLSRLRFAQWRHLLVDCCAIDQTIKGERQGDVWCLLQSLCLAMNGRFILA